MAAKRPTEVRPPPEGIWRVARGPDPYALRPPLSPAELNEPHAGNRFDSPIAAYNVLYFATDLRGCFGETLVRMRPDPRMVALVTDEWRESGFMDPAAVPADWRTRRLAVRTRVSRPNLFLDVESCETHRVLERELAQLLVVLGTAEIDVASVRGPDRRLTRWISQWTWSQTTPSGRPRYAGIRYLSRINSDWECWAVFDRARLQEVHRESIFRTDASLLAVANHFDLIVH